MNTTSTIIIVAAILLVTIMAFGVLFAHTVNKLREDIPKCVTVSPKSFVTIKPEAFAKIEYPKGSKPVMEDIDDETLFEISKIDIPNSLTYLSDPSVDQRKVDIRRRYVTVLAAIYGFEIPQTLYQLDAGAKKLFDLLIYTMQSIDAEELAKNMRQDSPFVAGCVHWEHLRLCNQDDQSATANLQRESLYKTYQPLETFIVGTLLQQHRGLVFPFWPTFEKRLKANTRRHIQRVYFPVDYRAAVTAIAIRKNIHIPQSYFLYSPLTEILVREGAKREGPNKGFHEAIKFQKVESS